MPIAVKLGRVWNLLKLMPFSQKLIFCYLQFRLIICMYWLWTIHYFISWVYNLQRNALCIICFAKFSDLTTQLFGKMKIMKFVGLVSVENYIFVRQLFFCKCYSVFSYMYVLATGRHNHQTRFAIKGLLILPICNTSKFGTKAFSSSTITSWNFRIYND